MDTHDKLYLDLMKQVLTFSLWKEPGRPVTDYTYRLHPILRFPARLTIRGLRRMNIDLVARKDYEAEARNEGHLWPGYGHTMMGRIRLDNLQYCVDSVLKNNVAGDLIETGVWRGGGCIFMKAILAATGNSDRRVFVADSFCGLPMPDPDRYPHDRGSDFHQHHSILAVSRPEVEANFVQFGLLDERVVFLEGWFKDTLPSAPIEKLALMRLDGDMYESTMQALEYLYPKLEPGGFCIIDDYAISACREAVDDYRERMGVTEPVERIDWTGVFWQKQG